MGASGLGATSPVSWNLIPTGDGPRRSVQRISTRLVYARAPSQRSTREGGQGARHRGPHRQQAQQAQASSSSLPTLFFFKFNDPTGNEWNRRFHDAQKGTDPRTGSWPLRADMTRVATSENEHAPVRGRCREEEKKRKKGGGTAAKQQAATRTTRARLS